MKENLTRKLEKLVKPALLVGALLGLLIYGLAKEPANAETAVTIGAPFASGEYTNGASLMLTEYFDNKYSISFGYITKQDIVDRSGTLYKTDPNLFVQGMRQIAITENLYGGLGVAYFNATNRALGSNFTAALELGYKINDRLSVQIRHYSNAGSARPNMGQDLLTATWRFK